MEENKLVKNLNERYSRNPILRGLIQLIPLGIGSGADVALVTTITNIREDRTKTFFDELSTGKIELNADSIKSEDFLHKFFITTKTALNTRRREKIKLFARLLLSSLKEDLIKSIDEYEEYLEILDDINIRELYILVTLEKYLNNYPKLTTENELQEVNKFWDSFSQEIIEKLKISKEEFKAFLTKLQRTGCYAAIAGTYFDYDGDKGNLTPFYYKLKELIQLKGEDFI